MKTQLDLQEYASTECELTAAQLDLLLRHAQLLDLSIEPVVHGPGTYRLTASSTVGAVQIGDLSIMIEPKIGIAQLLSLASYAMGVFQPQEQRQFDFAERESLPDALALALTSAARQAFGRGLLHGYRSEEQALQTVRGRIRMAEQMRRRFGAGLPVEVRFDEFTDDIIEHQLVRAAVMRLGSLHLRSDEARRQLSWVTATLERVTAVEFQPDEVPAVQFDRLNGHYRGVVGLARLVLRHAAFQSDRGDIRASGFLIDMDRLFQEFLISALRDALGVSEQTLHSDRDVPESWLAKGRQLRIRPDLSWWDGPICTFVGDAKYKNLSGSSAPRPDLYQLLAYATALDLPGGLLVYAHGEAVPASYLVAHARKRLEVTALDLSGELATVLQQVEQVAQQVLALRDEARSLRRTA